MKIFYKTFGCRVNQIETESISEKLSSLYQRTDKINEADIVFINSCTITENADKDVLNIIKKANNLNKKIYITGCYSSLFPSEILKINDKITIVSNKDKEKIPEIISNKHFKRDCFKVEASYGKTRAFVKIQDGCNLKCSYCIVPFARNEIKSKESLSVKEEIENLIKKKFKDITLSGTRLGYYKCPKTGLNLKDLLSILFNIEGDFILRLSSIEPMEITEDLLKVLKQNENKFADHFHLSLQSANDKILKLMNRPYDKNFIIRILKLIKEYFPNAGIYSDIISSFPGETEEEFNSTISFLKEYKISGLHPFSYSVRPNTLASTFKQLPLGVKKERAKIMRDFDKVLRNSFLNSMIGKKLKCLVLKNEKNKLIAISTNFMKVSIVSDKKIEKNSFIYPKIISVKENYLIGII